MVCTNTISALGEIVFMAVHDFRVVHMLCVLGIWHPSVMFLRPVIWVPGQRAAADGVKAVRCCSCSKLGQLLLSYHCVSALADFYIVNPLCTAAVCQS